LIEKQGGITPGLKMKANIEVSYAPDGEVLKIRIPEAIQALPETPRLAIWSEVTFMLGGMIYDKGDVGKVHEIGQNLIRRRKKAQHTWYDHTLELRVSGNRREKPHDYSQTEGAQD